MDAVVQIHSLLRWVVLIAGVAALAVAAAGWAGSGPGEKTSRQVTLLYAITLDIQVLVGIVIWLLEQRWQGGGRQFQLEHPAIMLVALIVAHIFAARARRAPGLPAARTRTIGNGVSLLLILAGIPWNR
jgi:hypothetical protein